MAKKPVKTVVKKQKNGDVVIIKKNKVVDVKQTRKGDYEVGKGKPPKHTQFKKGQSGNPGGVPINPEKRALKELTTRSLKEAIEKTLTCTEEEVTALLNDPSTTVGHKVILRAALDAAHHGEYSKFDQILERAIGKVASKVDMNLGGGLSLDKQLENKTKIKQALKEIESEF